MPKIMLALVVSALLVLGLALGLRYGLVEVEGLGVLCSQGLDSRCGLRQWIIEIFTHNRLGYLSLGAALLALIPRLQFLAWLAWCGGLMGLVLYCFDTSAPAALLALLILARSGIPHSRQSAAQA